MNRLLFGMSVLMVSAIFFTTAVAQAQRAGRKPVAEIKKVTTNSIRTPEYDVQVQGGGSSRVREDWFEVEVEYDTDPDWISELTLTYYILCEAKSKSDVETAGGKKYNLFTTSIIHRDVEEGKKHLGAAYLHPSTFKRFGNVSRVAVVISHDGAVASFASEPASTGEWWESPKIQPAKKGYILNRWQTPFIFHKYEDYGQIKLSNQ